MSRLFVVFSVLFSWSWSGVSHAQDFHFEGDVPEGPDTFFFLEFEVPEGVAEIEVVHTHIPVDTDNVLDWGVDDPNGSRGWGGSNNEDTVIGVEAASRNYIPGPMPAGTWWVSVGKARLVDGEPAGYSVDVFLRETATLVPQPRAPYQDPGVINTEARWYAGDFHVHTRESGDTRSTLTLDEALTFATGQGLDFVMLSEHNTNSGFTLYEDVRPRYPTLLIFPGQEFTTYKGHANAIGALENVDYTVDTGGYTIEDAIRAFQAQGAVFSINHPSIPLPDCRGCSWDFEDFDPTLIGAVEVQTAILRGIIFWEDLLDAGSRATALGGSDDHRAGQNLGAVDRPIGTPTTMVFAESLSVDAILEAVRSGRTTVKLTGPSAPMLDTTMTGERVGNTVFADRATLRAEVTDGEGFTLRVIKNRESIQSIRIDGSPFIFEAEVEAPSEGADRYRHELVNEGGPQTLSSYVWLEKGTAPPVGGSGGNGGTAGTGAGGNAATGGSGGDDGGSGCSVQTSAHGAWLGLGMLLGWALFRRRARRIR
ncbi:MAG: CehA/McbA family metallohydrolase [Myxococcota bacterium]